MPPESSGPENTDFERTSAPSSELGDWYRVIVAGAVVVIFLTQKVVEFRLHGRAKIFAGYAISLAFLVGTVELATGSVLRLAFRVHRRLGQRRARELAIVGVATVLLLANIRSDVLSGYVQAVPQASLTRTSAVVVALWLLFAVHTAFRGTTALRLLLALTALLVVTRLQAYANTPSTNLSGDMFPTLDLALDTMFAGRFPYQNYPPPMPYFPLTFLMYAPPKLLGWDLRVSNLIVEMATIAALAWSFGNRRFSFSAGSQRVALNGYLLPLFLLLPTFTFYSANAPMAPTVFAAVLVGRSLASGTAIHQAVALGAAVGTNPTLAALGFAVAGCWLRQHSVRRTIVLSALAAAIGLAVVAPFLVWDARQFVALFSALPPFSDAQFAGRFTLNPLVASLASPYAIPVALIVSLVISGWLGFSAKSTAGVLAGAVFGLSVALLLFYRTFSHYFLPVMALAAMGQPSLNEPLTKVGASAGNVGFTRSPEPTRQVSTQPKADRRRPR